MDFLDFISLISFWISIIGVIVIFWGTFLVAIAFIREEFLRIFKRAPKTGTNTLRTRLGLYILLGLEFMIAGDIIHTVLKPSKESLIILGSIVAIRSVISFFLQRELKAGVKQ